MNEHATVRLFCGDQIRQRRDWQSPFGVDLRYVEEGEKGKSCNFLSTCGRWGAIPYFRRRQV